MTVYVDSARTPARVGGTSGRWSHLTADEPDELHRFARSIGLRRAWFQARCRQACGRPGERCPHWHYDVTENMRAVAVRAGAREVGLRELGDLIARRRAAGRLAAEGQG